MPTHYSASLLRTLRNRIPIDAVIVDMLRMDIRPDENQLRFCCPLCGHFHTATNSKTNLARCFDCEKNFNPIDLVITVTNSNFVEAVEWLKKKSLWMV
jgi:predicted RNA-binding Zn-ribbon protein involved in translation (DUF1610 family)